jgi:hypothetical protein
MRRPKPLLDAVFAARYVAGSHRATFPLLGLVPSHRRGMVRRSTDVCIEGLPRSANTYAVTAFMSRNPALAIAHHVHVPMQFLRAVRLGIPCAVLIREPLETLTSIVIAREEQVSHDLAFRVYVDYLRRLRGVRRCVALCTFHETLADGSVIARRLNERFGTTFRDEPITPGERSELVAQIRRLHVEIGSRPGYVTVPSPDRESRKPQVRERLRRHPLLATARGEYDRLAATVASAPTAEPRARVA